GSAALRPTSRRKPAGKRSAAARAVGWTEPTATAGHGLAVPEQAQSEGPAVTPPPSRKRAPACASATFGSTLSSRTTRLAAAVGALEAIVLLSGCSVL